MDDPTWDLPRDLDASSWEHMAPITPRGYVCYYTSEPPSIDGRLDANAWQNAPWSDRFADIEGDRRPAPRHETRVAMRWDEEYLYIAARLAEPHVWATISEKNSVLFQENDFEVFIDPDGDNHNYYELEINALNTIWELTMEKPYRDGGPAVSPTNIEGLRSAVFVDGTLNAPHDEDNGWSLELAIPWEGLERYKPGPFPPEDGEQWRMNFSRVHWDRDIEGDAYRKVPDAPEHNWVWSPQGVVDMHRPERWGIVQFSRAPVGSASFDPDRTLPFRDALMGVYYAQRQFRSDHGRWAESLSDLDVVAVDHRLLGAVTLDAADEESGWTAQLPVVVGGTRRILQVDHTSRLTTLD